MRDSEPAMKLKTIGVNLDFKDPRVILHEIDCTRLGIQKNDLIDIAGKSKRTAVACQTSTLVRPGEAILTDDLMMQLGIEEGEEVEISYCPRPRSIYCIRKTMDRKTLSDTEIKTIINDIMISKLSHTGIAAWLTAIQINGLGEEEVMNLAIAMAETGSHVEFDKPVFDFHSVGGVPGNKITPIIVSIVAAAGLLIPKTSSRAISSACGTADFVEVFCDVNMDANQLKNVAEKTGGSFSWGGAMGMVPVNNILIDVQYPLKIDPRSMMVASILSKKLAVGSRSLVIDIPMGPGTKVNSAKEAEIYAHDFINIGRRLGIEVECATTNAQQPLGHSIGPSLEAKECIQVLEGERGLNDVKEKAISLAGMILGMAGMDEGEAKKILESGMALEKFHEIVAAQGGNGDIKSSDIALGRYSVEIESVRGGYVNFIDNKALVAIARATGAPGEKGGGLLLQRKLDQRVERGDVLFEIFSDHPERLERARGLAMKLRPLWIGGMLIERVPRIAMR
ncbi:MAG: phosphorylase [Candidatus Methanomethylophilaceae archaeon]|nr:phosphorylase [Candidatus Methanomethylophilaceae archaeon]